MEQAHNKWCMMWVVALLDWEDLNRQAAGVGSV